MRPERAWAAAGFAARAHDGQRRLDGRPFIVHPLDVAGRLAEVGVGDDDILSAALLHDVVEDTKVTLLEIEKEFGQRVALWVAQLTLPPTFQADYVKKTTHQAHMMSVMTVEGRLVKIADKFSNVSDLLANPPKWGRTAMLGYARDAQTVISAGIDVTLREAEPNWYGSALLELGKAASAAVVKVVERYG